MSRFELRGRAYAPGSIGDVVTVAEADDVADIVALLSAQLSEHRGHGDDIYADLDHVYAVDPMDPRYRTLYQLVELS